jgi:hypothetical protein
METDLRHSEPSSRAVEREKLASAEQWASWTTDQIRSAIEAEREQTFDLLIEVLASCRLPKSGNTKRFTTKVK